MPSSPDVALSSSPMNVAIRDFRGSRPGIASSPDPYEADLDGALEPSKPSSLGLRKSEAERFEESVADLAGRARRFLRATYAFIDEKRGRLPPGVREPLAKVPAAAFLIAALVLLAGTVFGIILLVGVAVGARGKSPVSSGSGTGAETAPISTGPATAATAATDAELAAAKEKGVDALGQLEGKYPKDPRVLSARMKAEISAKKHAEAVATVGRLLALDPKLSESPEVASALWTTAQAKDSSDGAYALLEGPMGTRGADLVYDLATTKGVRPDVRARAEKWLEGPAFQKQASPALAALMAMKKASTCRQRQGLLARAKDEGDERMLSLLESYASTRTGCGKRGKDDCHACMRADKSLSDTIAALEKRLGK
jgi:hypothetical protein